MSISARKNVYTDTIKKRPLYIYMYINLLQTNADFSFNYFAAINVIMPRCRVLKPALPDLVFRNWETKAWLLIQMFRHVW